MIATFILKSLAIGYALTAIGAVILTQGKNITIEVILITPIVFWPATLIISVLALLVFRAIKEQINR